MSFCLALPIQNSSLILFCLKQMGNKGAFIRFEAPEMKPQFTKFGSVVSFTCLEPHTNAVVLAVSSELHDARF